MSTVFALLIDLYLAAVALDWLLAVTRFQVDPSLRAKLHQIVDPFPEWIRTTIRPSFNGVDLSRIAAIVLLLTARTLVLVVGRW